MWFSFGAVTNLPSLQESRPEILGRKEEGVYNNLQRSCRCHDDLLEEVDPRHHGQLKYFISFLRDCCTTILHEQGNNFWKDGSLQGSSIQRSTEGRNVSNHSRMDKDDTCQGSGGTEEFFKLINNGSPKGLRPWTLRKALNLWEKG